METVTEIRVRYSETDAMGIVYNANYLVWFEVARTELFRKLGLPYTRFEAEGLALAVIEANLRYKAAARYDDVVELRAEVGEINPRKVIFNYQLTSGQKVLCEGSTVHFFVNHEGRAISAAGYPVWQDVKRLLL